MAQEEQEMTRTPEPHPQLNPLGAPPSRDPEEEASAPDESKGVGEKRAVWRIFARGIELVIAGVFVFAGIIKIVDFLPLNLPHANWRDFTDEMRTFFEQMRLANPRDFAIDIDNYKIVPWRIAVDLALYLPWLEMFCGVALIVRRLYDRALLILTALVSVFILASIIAKARGIDITFG